ncbi:hypothetical protein D3C81_1179080 [compost metagenome]
MIDNSFVLELPQFNAVGELPAEPHVAGKVEHVDQLGPTVVECRLARAVPMNARQQVVFLEQQRAYAFRLEVLVVFANLLKLHEPEAPLGAGRGAERASLCAAAGRFDADERPFDTKGGLPFAGIGIALQVDKVQVGWKHFIDVVRPGAGQEGLRGVPDGAVRRPKRDVRYIIERPTLVDAFQQVGKAQLAFTLDHHVRAAFEMEFGCNGRIGTAQYDDCARVLLCAITNEVSDDPPRVGEVRIDADDIRRQHISDDRVEGQADAVFLQGDAAKLKFAVLGLAAVFVALCPLRLHVTDIQFHGNVPGEHGIFQARSQCGQGRFVHVRPDRSKESVIPFDTLPRCRDRE